MITKEQFDRFLKNECNAEEELLVRKFLNEHPERVSELFPVEEFEDVEVAAWDPERSAAFFRALERNAGRPARLKKLVRISAVAASVVLMVSMVIWLTRRNGESNKGSIAEVAQKDTTTSSLHVSKWNTTDRQMKIDLPDGSMVLLSPQSAVDYAADFGTSNERKITLRGEGYFEVAKNKAKPFRVISDAISTTALGTSFTISAFDSDQSIRVQLHSGIVVVGDAVRKDRPSFADISMNPGQELIYDKLKRTASLVLPREMMAVSTKIRAIKGEKPQWYQFGGQNLPQVFEQLSNYYGVTINYVPAEVKNRYFTGKFSQTDSIETILLDISRMHGFRLEKSGNVYQFRKK